MAKFYQNHENVLLHYHWDSIQPTHAPTLKNGPTNADQVSDKVGDYLYQKEQIYLAIKIYIKN